MNLVKKVWLDTTTSPTDGKYSRKSLMMWGTFFLAIGLSIASIWHKVSVELIVVLLCFSFGITTLSVVDKYFNKAANGKD